MPGFAGGVFDEAEPFAVLAHPGLGLGIKVKVEGASPAVVAGARLGGQPALGVQALALGEIDLGENDMLVRKVFIAAEKSACIADTTAAFFWP